MLPWLHGHPAHQRHILVVGDEVTVQFDPEGQKVGDLLDRIGQDSFIGARMERDNVVAVPRTTLYMKVCDISESHRRTGIATLKWEGASRLSSTQPSSTRVPTPPPLAMRKPNIREQQDGAVTSRLVNAKEPGKVVSDC